MSGGANKAFLADPETWMRSNLLLVAIQELVEIADPTKPTGKRAEARYNGGELVECNILRSNKDTGQTATGGRAIVYNVNRSTGGGNYSHRFNAYYLPFFNNDFRVMLLDPTQFPPGADIFFTDSVNGCSFAAGPGARPKVGHFNRVDNNQMIDQPTMNNQIANEFGGGTVVKLTKATYKGDNVGKAATVFGVKEGGMWRFYWQSREIVGMNTGGGTVWQMGNPAVSRCNNAG